MKNKIDEFDVIDGLVGVLCAAFIIDAALHPLNKMLFLEHKDIMQESDGIIQQLYGEKIENELV